MPSTHDSDSLENETQKPLNPSLCSSPPNPSSMFATFAWSFPLAPNQLSPSKTSPSPSNQEKPSPSSEKVVLAKPPPPSPSPASLHPLPPATSAVKSSGRMAPICSPAPTPPFAKPEEENSPTSFKNPPPHSTPSSPSASKSPKPSASINPNFLAPLPKLLVSSNSSASAIPNSALTTILTNFPAACSNAP